MTIADATRKFVRRRANYSLKDVGWIYIPDGSKTIYLEDVCKV